MSGLLTVDPAKFYDDIAAVYHLVYADWETSIERQAAQLDSILKQALGSPPHCVLDVSCGIGTQTLGLASLGYEVTASDISPASVARARSEAAQRGLDIVFSVADMRHCDQHHSGTFDVVLSADNSVPHLLTDSEMLMAFRAMYNATQPGGVTLITVRDYANEDRTTPRLVPYGVRKAPEGRWLVFQVWDFAGDLYDLTMYFLWEPADGFPRVVVSRSRYYAIGLDRLTQLLRQAGFTSVERIIGRFFQPVLIGMRAVSD